MDTEKISEEIISIFERSVKPNEINIKPHISDNISPEGNKIRISANAYYLLKNNLKTYIERNFEDS